jgi:hypothetical protein
MRRNRPESFVLGPSEAFSQQARIIATGTDEKPFRPVNNPHIKFKGDDARRAPTQAAAMEFFTGFHLQEKTCGS